MIREFAPKHFDIGIGLGTFRPVEGVARRMHPDECLAVLNLVQERLFVRERQDARRVGKNEAVVLLQGIRRHFGGDLFVGPRVIHGEPRLWIVREFAQDLFGGRDRAVAEAFCHGDYQ